MQKDLSFKKIILLAAGVWMAFVLIIFLANNSLVNIQTTENSDLTLQKIGSDDPKIIKPGLRILSKGSYVVHAKTQDKETIEHFFIKPLRKTSVKISLLPQKTLYKIATGASPCIAGEIDKIKKGDLYSFDCANLGSLTSSSFKRNKINEPVLQGLERATTGITAYKNGVVGLVVGDTPDKIGFIYKSYSAPLAFFSLGKWISSGDTKNYYLQVEGDKLYLLDVAQKKIFIFNDIGSSPQARDLPVNEKSWPGTITFRAKNNNAFVLSARSDEDTADSFSEATLYISRPAGKPKVMSIDKAANELLDFDVVNESVIAGHSTSASGLQIYDIAGSKPKLLQSFPDVSSVVSREDGVYAATKEGSVYRYVHDDGSLYLVYGSNNTKITSIKKMGGNIVVNGYQHAAERGGPPNQSFLLTDTSFAGQSRLEDFLPYSKFVHLLPIVDMDYVGNDIRVALLLDSFVRGGALTAPGFDKDEFEKDKRLILDTFEKDGFDSKNFDFTFLPD